jgi:hypothetical protein
MYMYIQKKWNYTVIPYILVTIIVVSFNLNSPHTQIIDSHILLFKLTMIVTLPTSHSPYRRCLWNQSICPSPGKIFLKSIGQLSNPIFTTIITTRMFPLHTYQLISHATITSTLMIIPNSLPFSWDSGNGCNHLKEFVSNKLMKQLVLLSAKAKNYTHLFNTTMGLKLIRTKAMFSTNKKKIISKKK